LHHGRLGVAAVTADYGATVGVRFTPDDGQAAPSGERWTRAYLRDATNRAADRKHKAKLISVYRANDR